MSPKLTVFCSLKTRRQKIQAATAQPQLLSIPPSSCVPTKVMDPEQRKLGNSRNVGWGDKVEEEADKKIGRAHV